MIPVVERQMRTLTVGIGTLFDGNCGEKSFQGLLDSVRERRSISSGERRVR